MIARCILLSVLLSLPVAGADIDRRIPVTAKINDQSVRLAFDSGYGGSILIWRKVAERLGLKVEAAPADVKPAPGEVIMAKSAPAKFEIFGQIFPDARFHVYEPPPYLPMDIEGFVGWDGMKNNVVVFRFAERDISVVGTVPGPALSWTKLSVRSDLPHLVLTLPGVPGAASGSVMIDTGIDSGLHLSAEKWREWRDAHQRAPATFLAYHTPGSGLVIREECWADEIAIGGLILRGVKLSESNLSESQVAGAGYVATLGLAALCRLDLVVDGVNGVAYAKARAEPALPVEHNRLGAVFVPKDEVSDDLEARVATNSPAATAGIRNGDVLLKIDQLDVTMWRTKRGILPLARFWQQAAGTSLQLTLRRGTQTVTNKVVLKDILGPGRSSAVPRPVGPTK